MSHSTQGRRKTREKSPVATTAYFEFDTPMPVNEDALKMLRGACLKWIANGKTVVRGNFGVSSSELFRDEKGYLRGTYRAVAETCCPFGLILDGTESHFMPVLDAMKVLGVDEFWAVGFLHGFDDIPSIIIGKRREEFQKLENYRKGKQAGRELLKEFE